MKLSIQLYEGYANTPEFIIEYGEMLFDAPHIIPLPSEGGHERAWYIAFNQDLSVAQYRRLCEFRTDGNTNFGYPEAGYMSGWSGRVSCINKDLGYHYVDVSSRGVELKALLSLIKSKYVGEVFISSRESHIDMEYIVEPYFHAMHNKYDTCGNYLIIHTVDPDFIEQAMITAVGNDYNQMP